MNIILLAPPAAGKGTQCEILVEKYNLTQISTGNLLRDIAKEETELGKKVKEVLTSGDLVNDELVYQIVENYLDNNENQHGYIFDGFPRTESQAKRLDTILKDRNKKIDYVFFLDTEKEILRNRVLGRRTCKQCGRIYNANIDILKPKKDLICDNCGGELYIRDEDNLQSFEVRYNTYIDKIQPLIDYYKQQNLLYKIDSSHSKENTFEQIQTIIKN